MASPAITAVVFDVGGVLIDTLLDQRRRHRVPLIVSTNWGAESWGAAKAPYEFLSWFDGALVSGEVTMAKPDPAFFELLESRFSLHPPSTLYIEDTMTDLEAAADHGSVTHHFVPSHALAADLGRHGLLHVPAA